MSAVIKRAYVAWDFDGPAIMRFKDADGLAEWQARKWDVFTRTPFISDVTDSFVATFRRFAPYLLRCGPEYPNREGPTGFVLVVPFDGPPRIAHVYEGLNSSEPRLWAYDADWQAPIRDGISYGDGPDNGDQGVARALAGYPPRGLPALTQVGDEWRLRTPDEDVTFRALIAARAATERAGAEQERAA